MDKESAGHREIGTGQGLRERPARATSFLLLTHQEMLGTHTSATQPPVPVTWGLLAWGPWGSAQQKTEASWAWSPGGGESRPVWPEVQGTKGHRVLAEKGAEGATLEPLGRQWPPRKCQGWALPRGSGTPRRCQQSEWRRPMEQSEGRGSPSCLHRPPSGGTGLAWEGMGHGAGVQRGDRVGRRRGGEPVASLPAAAPGSWASSGEGGDLRAGSSDLKDGINRFFLLGRGLLGSRVEAGRPGRRLLR